MRYFIDSESKIINVFAPVEVKDLMKELISLGKDYADFHVNTVWAKVGTGIQPIGSGNPFKDDDQPKQPPADETQQG